MTPLLVLCGVLFLGLGWVVWDSRFIVASDHFRQLNARLGISFLAMGALMLAIAGGLTLGGKA